jgi:hypothetical protein
LLALAFSFPAARDSYEYLIGLAYNEMGRYREAADTVAEVLLLRVEAPPRGLLQ